MLDALTHHLRVFGITTARSSGEACIALADNVVVRLAWMEDGRHDSPYGDQIESRDFVAVGGRDCCWSRLRSLHSVRSLRIKGLIPVVTSLGGEVVWGWRARASGGELLVGTDLIQDLIRFRQGNPAAAANRPSEAQWGIPGERPTYLFDDQLEPDRPYDRQADWWLWTLREAVCRLGGVEAVDVLPFGAPGAVIVTGDDDQAPLDDYEGQARKLGNLPVTYFLHPLTKHNRASLMQHSQGRLVEWELHPDALDTPEEYSDRLREQCEWFTELVGHRPRLLRNHGFLNDGYWGHARSWIAEAIQGSSNLPGFDGRVLNGSLLPARLVLNGSLTPHWSILTTFGDGVFFVHGWTDDHALAAIEATADRIIASGVPGIIVLNLHPTNHAKAAAMHEAAHRLVERCGFVAMTLGDAVSWFSQRDAGVEAVPTPGMLGPGSVTRAPTRRMPQRARHDVVGASVRAVRRIAKALGRLSRRRFNA